MLDTGPGIEPEALSRLFDPFFTTKPPGEGSGLGLSVSYGIVTEHKGRLRGENRTDRRGAIFTVELPRGRGGLSVRPLGGPAALAGLALLAAFLGMGVHPWRGWPVPGAPAHHREHGFANANPDFARPPFWTRTSFFVRRMWAATFSPGASNCRASPTTAPRCARTGRAHGHVDRATRRCWSSWTA